MAHSEKFTKAAIFGIASHIERKTENHSNEFIDISRTRLNYSLLNDDSDLITRLNNRLAEVHVYNRKDVNVMVDWVVTLPEELKDATESDKRDFFSNTHDFLVNRYGGLKNVVCSEIHVDETTPHLHFGFIPVVYDENRDQERVQANKVIDRKELKMFHDDLHNYLRKAIPGIYQEGILNGKTVDVKNVKELKALDKQIKIEKEIREKELAKTTAYKKPLENFNKIEKNAKRSILGNIQFNDKELNAIKSLISSSNKVSSTYEKYKKKADTKIESLRSEKIEFGEAALKLYEEVDELKIKLDTAAKRTDLLEKKNMQADMSLQMLDIFTGGNSLYEMQGLNLDEFDALITLVKMRDKDFMKSEKNLKDAKEIFESVPKTSRIFEPVSKALNLVLEKLIELANSLRFRGPRL